MKTFEPLVFVKDTSCIIPTMRIYIEIGSTFSENATKNLCICVRFCVLCGLEQTLSEDLAGRGLTLPGQAALVPGCWYRMLAIYCTNVLCTHNLHFLLSVALRQHIRRRAGGIIIQCQVIITRASHLK